MSNERILRLPEVERITGLRRDTVYRLAREGAFPKPIKLSARASGWIESEVDGFVQQRISASRALIA